MLISLTVETSGRGSHAFESLTVHKITTFRCKYIPTMATGDDDDDDEDGATTTTTTTTTTTAMARRAMGYDDNGGGRR